MKWTDPDWLSILSELFVDLSAGWFGAVFIVPNFTGIDFPFNLVILTGDITAGIVCLVIAFRLKKLSRKNL